MNENMLGKLVKQLVEVPDELGGPLYDLFKKVTGQDRRSYELWLKRLLRKEPIIPFHKTLHSFQIASDGSKPRLSRYAGTDALIAKGVEILGFLPDSITGKNRLPESQHDTDSIHDNQDGCFDIIGIRIIDLFDGDIKRMLRTTYTEILELLYNNGLKKCPVQAGMYAVAKHLTKKDQGQKKSRYENPWFIICSDETFRLPAPLEQHERILAICNRYMTAVSTDPMGTNCRQLTCDSNILVCAI